MSLKGKLMTKKAKRAKRNTDATKRTRRSFSDAQKRRIIAEIDKAPRGAKANVLEKHGLTSSQASLWRRSVKQRQASSMKRTRTRARRGENHISEVEALRDEVARLQQKLTAAKQIVLRELLGSL